MQIFDKSKIKSNFNQANQRYNTNAVLQKIVAKNLVQFAKEDILSAKRVIDLGCGTGFVADQISIIKNISYPDESIFQLDIAYQMLQANHWSNNKINADIESLPLKDNYFDLVISSLSFQWLNDLRNSIFQSFKTIKSEGAFYFSIIADGSLRELKQSCRDCGVNFSVNDFISQKDLEEILKNLNLAYETKLETITLDYQDFYSLLKSIKAIGAGYSKNRHYINKTRLQEIANFYLKNFNLRDKVFATWQILYVSIKQNQNHV